MVEEKHDLLSAMWQALIRETCINPASAKTVVFLGEEKFRKALAPFAATSSPTPADVQAVADRVNAGVEQMDKSQKVDSATMQIEFNPAPAERTRVEGEQETK